MAVYRTTLRGIIYGQSMNIVRYWDLEESPPDFQALVDEWGLILAGTWDLATHTECELTDVYISAAVTGSLGFALTPANFPLVGTLTPTTGLPPHDAVLSVYSSNVMDYPRQNRNRLGGANEGQIEGGTLNASGLSLWTAVAQALATSFNYGEAVAVAVLWSDQYQNSNTVGNVTVRSAISTQRSRRVGVGS